MDFLSMSIEQLEKELEKYNSLDKNEMELFKSGKDFVDKAIENRYIASEKAKIALWIYAIYQIKKNNIM